MNRPLVERGMPTEEIVQLQSDVTNSRIAQPALRLHSKLRYA